MTLNDLYTLILDRKNNPKPSSYTNSLFDSGLPRIAQKVGEEGTEVVVAALAQENARLVEEIADLTYHVLVLMTARGLTPAEVLAETRQPLEGGPPYSVRLSVPSARIDARHTYAARAEIRDPAGALRFTTDTRHAVLTQGAPNRADIILIGVR